MADIEITHSRADGTLLDGSSKGDGVLELVRPYGFRWFRSLGMLGITHTRDKRAQHWRIDGAAKALRDAGHEVTVKVDEDERRSFSDAEADRVERAGDRAERYDDRAGRASSEADARFGTADRLSERFAFGQPILVGHHSERRARRDQERIATNMRAGIAASDRAGYWSDRTRAAANYEVHRNDPERTRRRIQRLEADKRRIERRQAEWVRSAEEGKVDPERLVDALANLDRDHLDLTDEIAHWRRLVEKAKADGVKLWESGDFVAGDFVMYYGSSWYEVKRVNPKTLSIAWNLRLAPKQVMTLEDATDNGRTSTHSADYTNVRARCPGEAMRSFLADGKVPGTKSAHEASEAAPADAIREAQAAAKAKPRRRSGRKSPGRVELERAEGAGEGTPEGGAERQVSAGDEVGERPQASDLQISRVNNAEMEALDCTGKWVPTKVDLVQPTTTKGDAVTATATKTAKRPAKAKGTAKADAAQPAELKSVQKVIPLDRIDADPNQPRKSFDEAKLQELANSIGKLGLLQPVNVRYIPATRRYMLIMGERRWRASKMAGLTEIPAVVMHGIKEGDPETLMKAVAENVGRADMTAMEEANAFNELKSKGYSIDDISESCGKSAAYVGWRIDLLRLSATAQEALAKGHLTVNLAWYVSQLSADNQTRFLSRWTRGDFKSSRDAEAFVQAAKAEEARQASQGSFFVLSDEATAQRSKSQDALPGAVDLPESERERIVADRQKLTNKIDRLSTAGQILSELVAADPAELALLLAGAPGGVPGHQLRIEHLRDLTTKAIKNLREAQAIAAVRGHSALAINPQATDAE